VLRKQSEHDPILREHLISFDLRKQNTGENARERSYVSHMIPNELIELLGDYLEQRLLDRVKKAFFFNPGRWVSRYCENLAPINNAKWKTFLSYAHAFELQFGNSIWIAHSKMGSANEQAHSWKHKWLVEWTANGCELLNIQYISSPPPILPPPPPPPHPPPHPTNISHPNPPPGGRCPPGPPVGGCAPKPRIPIHRHL